MEEIKTIKGYFNKLQRTVLYEASFKIFSKEVIKKSKIDDVLCCIIATFPVSYKKMLNMKDGKKYRSVLSYNLLTEALKRKFILNSDLYYIDVGLINKLVGAILKSIEADIKEIENLYNQGN